MQETNDACTGVDVSPRSERFKGLLFVWMANLSWASARAETPAPGDLAAGVAQLESRYGGRLGVAVLDSASGRTASYRGNERFPMCSTFKSVAAVRMLALIDAGSENSGRRIAYDRVGLVTYFTDNETASRKRHDIGRHRPRRHALVRQ